MSRATPPKTICAIEIGYSTFVMPLDKALKVMALMEDSVSCEKHYAEREFRFRLREKPEVTVQTIKPSQCDMPEKLQRGPRLIGQG